MTGVPPSGSGLRPFGVEPQDASQAEPLVPNAMADHLDDLALTCLERRGCRVLDAAICNVLFPGDRDMMRMVRQDTFSPSRDLADAQMLLRFGALWAVGDMEDGPFARVVWPQPCGGYGGGHHEAFASSVPLALCSVCLRASAIEARRAETQGGSVADESVTAESGDAQ